MFQDCQFAKAVQGKGRGKTSAPCLLLYLSSFDGIASDKLPQCGYLCSRQLEGFEPDVCSRVDATHLVLKVISDKTNAHMRDRGDVLGNALLAGDGTGYYAYAFQDHIGILERKLGFALLGYVLTHEVGHLLLGSNSHAVNGIMSPHWNGAELRRISEGTLLFPPDESRMLRERLRLRRADVPIVTSAKAVAEPN